MVWTKFPEYKICYRLKERKLAQEQHELWHRLQDWTEAAEIKKCSDSPLLLAQFSALKSQGHIEESLWKQQELLLVMRAAHGRTFRTAPEGPTVKLSRYAGLRSENELLILDSPLSNHVVEFHDTRACHQSF